MSKKRVSLSIEESVDELANRLGINKSAAAQRGIEAELNMPIELKDLIKERDELKAKLKIIEERISLIEEQEHISKKLRDDSDQALEEAIDILCERMATQPPVPHISWANQAKKTNRSISELQGLVRERCIKLDIEFVQ